MLAVCIVLKHAETRCDVLINACVQYEKQNVTATIRSDFVCKKIKMVELFNLMRRQQLNKCLIMFLFFSLKSLSTIIL